jgi:hypothetical protein
MRTGRFLMRRLPYLSVKAGGWRTTCGERPHATACRDGKPSSDTLLWPWCMSSFLWHNSGGMSCRHCPGARPPSAPVTAAPARDVLYRLWLCLAPCCEALQAPQGRGQRHARAKEMEESDHDHAESLRIPYSSAYAPGPVHRGASPHPARHRPHIPHPFPWGSEGLFEECPQARLDWP